MLTMRLRSPPPTCAPVPVAIASLLLALSPARAAGPIVDDLEGATLLRTEVPAPPPAPGATDPHARPEAGAPDGVAPVSAGVDARASDGDRSRQALVASGRWIGLPDALLGAFFAAHPSYAQGSAALAFETGATHAKVWSFEAAWMPLVPAGGNWQTRLSTPESALHVVSGLHMLTLDATYRSQYEAGPVRAFLGGGLGVAMLVGDVTTDEVLPDCAAPAANCAHWPTASRQTLDLPTRVLPILHLTGGLEVDLGDVLSLRVSGGFKNVLYLGLGLAARL